MAKILVIDPSTGTAVPFLRGILTRSLEHAGLAFDDAYKLAVTVRNELTGLNEISKRDLRARALKHLKTGYPEAAQAYRAGGHATVSIMVAQSEGGVSPFSRSRHQQRLQACGISNEQALWLTQMLFEHLLTKDISHIAERDLIGMTYSCLKRELDTESARRYLAYYQFRRSGRPLLLLIGGTAGSGKSTIATEAASLLEIVRAQSTDMLREVMRVMIPQRLLPVLHESSFQAWKVLAPRPKTNEDSEALLNLGFNQQAELVGVASDAVIQRALREHISLVMEGVHVLPALLPRIEEGSNAIVVPLVLAILDADLLRQRIAGRGTEVPQRRAERYLENFDSIWQLQSYLLSEADREHIPIIANVDKETTVREVMLTVNDRIGREFSGSVKEVFGDAIRRERNASGQRTDRRPPSSPGS